MSNNKIRTYQESHWRSIVKAVTWRVVATLTTFFITYYVFMARTKADLLEGIEHDLLELARKQARQNAFEDAVSFAGIVAVFELVIKLVLYYFHERIWQSVNVGWIRKHNRRRKINKIRRDRIRNLITRN
ncbi:MAG: DUF2061 domain-containing protein [Bacteroidetes bacterium]|jgi:uncharacterized membrane protein|nr:DUF2061 domain-containing protein [Bacteroidota bacterium]MBT5529322.1 DUF2061 domain-containing protein [Cytophagia bacterium]MBT3422766.1 DUF2061 domain-containing protein [Bacteroidota bacterium]MBT3800014.1 DUF2061 domain-containing protein [Bacteroidota bacterium]MBT3934053.1 DUF2061 domain-containing protein [Bacteroidota bacterium]